MVAQETVDGRTREGSLVKSAGQPYAGNPHVRLEEGAPVGTPCEDTQAPPTKRGGNSYGLAKAQPDRALLYNQSQSNLNQQYQINAGITNSNASNGQKAAGGLVQAAGSLLGGLSDIRSKENVKAASDYAGPDPNAMAKAMAPGVRATAPGASNSGAGYGSNYGAGQGGGANNGAMFNSQDSANFANIGATLGGNSASSGDSSGGGGMLSGLMGGGGGGILSDENSKEALSGIHPYQFDYKDHFAHEIATEAAQKAYAQAFQDAKTPRMGVMAQDLAKNPEARDTVTKTPEGMLAIDGKRALGFVLANQADFNDRLRAIESKRRKVA